MNDFNDENVDAAEKLKKLGRQLRTGLSDLHPMSKEHLLEARNEILEKYLERLEERVSNLEDVTQDSLKREAEEHDHQKE